MTDVENRDGNDASAATDIKKPNGNDEVQHHERPGMLYELGRATKTGMGMFTEAYFVFAIGTVGTLWHDMYPTTCFGEYTCEQVFLAITYVEIAGVITGQMLTGFFADHLGRLWGSRLTGMLLFLGGLLLTVSYGTNYNITGQMIMFNITVFIFTLGVGGEYPMAATSAAERSESENLPRGRTISFVFAHQGWGTIANAIVLCFLLAVTGTGGCTTAYSKNATEAAIYCNPPLLEFTWRFSYGIGVIIVFILLIYRIFILKESVVWAARQEKYEAMEISKLREQRVRNTRLIFSRKYFPRLFAAGFTWFLNDVGFYGNKLFAGTIITFIIGKQSSLQDVLNFALLNAFVGLCGYYLAAFTIDYQWMGRVRMQAMGFFIISVLFFVCGLYTPLSTEKAYVHAFEFIYLMSSLFQQFGPNVTTYLLPVELFPTDVRAQAHGYCAAFGKFGALFATLLFSYGANGQPFTATTIFIVSGAVSALGFFVTILMVPEMTKVTLQDVDRRWSIDRHEMQGETVDAIHEDEKH